MAECRFWRCVDIYDRVANFGPCDLQDHRFVQLLTSGRLSDLTSSSTELFKGISSQSLKHSMEAAFSAQFGLIVYIYTWEDTH